MGAHVILIDINLDRLRYLHEVMGGRLTTLSSNPLNIAQAVQRADLLVGAVLILHPHSQCGIIFCANDRAYLALSTQ
jgi:alanine dehydrogenase